MTAKQKSSPIGSIIRLGILVAALYGAWVGINWFIHLGEDEKRTSPSQVRQELQLPVVTRSEMETLARRMNKREVFDRIGRGVQETERSLLGGGQEECWLWREADQRDDRRFPLWSVCFVNEKLTSKGRYFDEYL